MGESAFIPHGEAAGFQDTGYGAVRCGFSKMQVMGSFAAGFSKCRIWEALRQVFQNAEYEAVQIFGIGLTGRGKTDMIIA